MESAKQKPRPSPGVFSTQGGAGTPMELPIMAGHFLPWYTVRGDDFPMPEDAAHPSPHPAPEANRHWRDERSGYRRTHLHMPLHGCYDSRDPAIIAWQLDTAYTHGFRAFAINWYGKHSVENLLTLHWLKTFAAWRSLHPERVFSYFFSLDSQMGWPTEGRVPVPLEEDIAYVRDHLLRDGYLLRDGRPVFSVFPYENNAPVWLAALDHVFGARGADLLWMNSAPGAGECGAYPWVRPDDGAISRESPYTWNDPDNAGEDWLRSFYRACGDADEGYLMGGVWPGFDDQLVSWAWNKERENPRVRPRVICRETSRGNTLALTWQAYMDYLRSWSRGDPACRRPAPLVQVITWNDYAEASSVEPTRDYGLVPLQYCRDRLIEARELWRDA